MDSRWIAAYLQSAPLREMDDADTEKIVTSIPWPETLLHITHTPVNWCGASTERPTQRLTAIED